MKGGCFAVGNQSHIKRKWYWHLTLSRIGHQSFFNLVRIRKIGHDQRVCVWIMPFYSPLWPIRKVCHHIEVVLNEHIFQQFSNHKTSKLIWAVRWINFSHLTTVLKNCHKWTKTCSWCFVSYEVYFISMYCQQLFPQ